MLAAGDLVGRSYRVVRLIGSGGMGEVYEGIHETLQRRVAIKTVRTDLAGESELISRFRREAEASAALGHPNIVQVTDFIIDKGRAPVMVMEYLEGRTLRELVASAQALEAPRAVFIAVQILSGLASAHRAGIIHRDVKPANVFLQKTLAVRDHVKLLDFGLAKLLESESTSKKGPVTERGKVLGTRAYMAPEQEAGSPHIDARADLYAVGATLYYALSGRRPRELHQPAHERAALNRVAPDLPYKLVSIVEKALALEPHARYENAEQMAEALMAFSSTTSGLGKATFMPGQMPPAPVAAAHAPPGFAATLASPGPPTAATAMAPSTEPSESAPTTERDGASGGGAPNNESMEVETVRVDRKHIDALMMESTLDDTVKTGKPNLMSETLNVADDSLQLETKRMQAVNRGDHQAAPATQHLQQPQHAGMGGGVAPISAPAPRISHPHPVPSASSFTSVPSSIQTTFSPRKRAKSKVHFVLLLTAFVFLLASALWVAQYLRL